MARRGTRLLAATVLASVTAAATTTGTAQAAPAPVSQSSGRFLSGSIAGTSLDTVAGIQGEGAQNFGGTSVLNQNSLNAELLNNAVVVPLAQGLQLPGLNVLKLGAVNQVAKANPDGSSFGASGAVSNSGGVGVGGQNGTPPANATLDLSGLGGSTLATTIGNLKASIGAVAATATQALGQNGAQSGTYQIGSLSLDLTSPAIASLVSQLTKAVGPQLDTVLNTVTSTTTLLGGVVVIGGTDTLPTIASSLTTLSVDGGALTLDLTSGSIHLDLAALLAANGLNINTLPPNTDLLPYIAAALAKLPGLLSATLTAFVSKLTTAFSALSITVAGVKISAAQLKTLTDMLTSALTSPTGPLAQAENAIAPILTTLVNQLKALLDIIVNVQESGGGVFTERALQLNLGSTALPSLPGLPVLSTPPLQGVNALPGARHLGAVSEHLGAVQTVPDHLVAAAAVAAAATSAIQLNLASASVGPGQLAVATTPATPTTTPPGIKVSAGQGPTDSGVDPVVYGGLLLLLIGVGGVVVVRRRAGGHL